MLVPKCSFKALLYDIFAGSKTSKSSSKPKACPRPDAVNVFGILPSDCVVLHTHNSLACSDI